ncbi:MAG: hypothetical protein J0L88_11090 [Xanthomonadales bacterium]|nr:hypothetical protein [Xanthomonadales bacterium]
MIEPAIASTAASRKRELFGAADSVPHRSTTLGACLHDPSTASRTVQ